MAKASWYLVGYDICCKKRLTRVHRFLKKEGLAVQKSLFFVHGAPSHLTSLFKGLNSIIVFGEDDIRAYPISHPSRVWMSGGPLARFPLLITHQPEQQKHGPKGWINKWFGKK